MGQKCRNFLDQVQNDSRSTSDQHNYSEPHYELSSSDLENDPIVTILRIVP